MDVLRNLLENVPIPKFIPVRQQFDGTSVHDVAFAVREAVAKTHVLERIQPDMKIAIGVGSRGVANLPDLVRTTVQLVKGRGAHPYIVPAMGSHGGATAAGQTSMLAHLGITQSSVGAPIRATMEVVQKGESSGGLPLFVDRYAAEADGIIVINRIKPHTSFRGKVESGLLKMLVIGLGKQHGADAAHALGFEHMVDHIWDLSMAWVERLPVLFGIGVIENGYDQTAKVVAVPAEGLHEEEQKLIGQARTFMPKIMFNPLDVLIVDEIGKDISGVGMDPNVTGRYPNNLVSGELKVSKVVVLRLTGRTDGNAAGVGLADVTTAALESRIDRVKGYMNSLTSTTMTTIKIPMVLATDKLAIQAAVKTSNADDLNQLRAVRIRNTLRLDEIWISEALLPEAQANEQVEIRGTPQVLAFEASGILQF